jgi:uncharacterized protein (DUF1697 family)
MTRRSTYVALLRGINVSGHNTVPMAELRAHCAALGWLDVRSYIQSGNLVFTAAGPAAGLERDLERALQDRFGLSVPVIIRTRDAWSGYVAGNPFRDAIGIDAHRTMLVLSKQPPRDGALEALHQRAVGGEAVAEGGGCLWIHYPAGAGASKLAPGRLDRLLGSPVTTRNWRTVLMIDGLAADIAPR